ncbi:hypothetical protein TREMEDRAFT_12302, partial [Tremella mesenterica DSM 1558]|uniref:uncharacterized protein n=1 Tax=Tremella mesenterica (strain ATCC 24925 / CBS 8224 / DSM 1558 / NBRC 9311 / NRRL Y-6157 / RJB 2259-6 / UBC 559-6) TaxID=578456 RepID=UPI0003F4A317
KRMKPGKTQTKKERDVYIPSTVTVARLADIFGVKLFQLRRRMLGIGINEDQTRATWSDAEEACNVALEFGMNPIVDDEKSFDLYPEPETESGQVQPLRPPVVTIMGHVDHGKTTLLDALRHTAVAAGEAGGITQHIGAFSVPLSSLSPSASPNSTITFLDTPGHAAFTAMRARGASVTDIVVLVVAADDGVMPQTKEVINLVKNSDVGLVVAINKCDKPGVDIERVKRDLGAEGLLLEEDGGDVQSVKVSGLTKSGLDELVETISTLAELRDLRARQDGKAEGYVLESRVDKGRGNIATVLVTRGTLNVGASIVSGTTWCRVRQMLDSRGQETHSVPPGTPIAVTGWKELPLAGDEMLEAPNGEDEAKRVVENRERDIEMKKLMTDLETLNIKRRGDRETLLAEREEKQAAHKEKRAVRHVNVGHEEGEERRELRLVIKADVSGTVEAVVGSLEAIGNKEAGVKVVHTGVGDITESDIDFASASDATIIGFSVEASRSIQNLAKQSSVTIHVDQVIYRLIDLVRSRVSSLLPPKIEKRVLGEASVLQLFPITIKRKTSMVAGCRVNNGILKKSDKVRVLRGTERKEVFEGSIHSLKHLKKDVEEVHKGMEFGIQMEGWNEVKEGDEVVTFNTIEIPREI